MQARFYVGAGAIVPQTLALSPKCDMKHCLTNSKYRHTGAKRSVLWPSKICQMRYRNFTVGAPPGNPMGEVKTLPRPIVGWGKDTLISHPIRRSMLPPSVLATRRLDIWRHCPEYFSLEPCLAAWWRWACCTVSKNLEPLSALMVLLNSAIQTQTIIIIIITWYFLSGLSSNAPTMTTIVRVSMQYQSVL